MTIQYIPLNDLVPSARNLRKVSPHRVVWRDNGVVVPERRGTENQGRLPYQVAHPPRLVLADRENGRIVGENIEADRRLASVRKENGSSVPRGKDRSIYEPVERRRREP